MEFQMILGIGLISGLAAIAALATLLFRYGDGLKAYFLALPGHRKAALAIAVITALAEVVIVYDLYTSGTWLAPGALSAAKTTAFVLLFIGSLIAEMQPLSRPLRGLLFVAVVALGLYQIQVNILVNYHHAQLPPSITAFFTYVMASTSEADTRFWAAIADGTVRTFVVIIMWLVTGLVWRGDALAKAEQQPAEGITADRSLSPESEGSPPVPSLTDHQLRQIEELVAVYREDPTATLGDVVRRATYTRSESVAGKVRKMALAYGYLAQGNGRSFHPNGRSPGTARYPRGIGEVVEDTQTQ